LATDIFLSVGSGLSNDQERFYAELRDVLRSRGLNPRTLGRTDYLPDNEPLDGISKVLEECHGVIVLALERSHSKVLIDRPGTANEQNHRDVRLPTVWNQIEATLAYAKRLPLLVIVDERLRSEGLLEERYDWLVLRVPLDAAAFGNPHVHGVLTQWVAGVQDKLVSQTESGNVAKSVSVESLTIREILSSLTVAQAWAIIGSIAIAASGIAGFAFWVGSVATP
jgi:hypothetical protein